jgi:hypothetical protein
LLSAPQERATEADLWIVAGKLSDWDGRRGGPSPDTEVWMWNGHLQRLDGSKINVESGIPDALDGEEGSSVCALSQALSAPQSHANIIHGMMHVAVHPAAGPKDCTLYELGQSPMNHTGAPALWLGRLALDSGSDVFSIEQPKDVGYHLRVMLRSTCCGRGFEGSSIRAAGEEGKLCDEDGCCKVCQEDSGSGITFRVDGIPPCLLPAKTCEYTAHNAGRGTVAVELDVSCRVWIWWVPPGATEDDDMEASMASAMSMTPKSCLSSPKAERGDGVPETLVWLAANVEHVPEDARPVKGRLECPSAADQLHILDGTTTGPFFLRQAHGLMSSSCAAPCVLSDLVFHADPPAGFEYLLREPSPLRERCEELGGCELSRLSGCPAVIGYYRQIQPPPLCVSLTSSCCCRPWPGALASLHGLTKFFRSRGEVHLRRKIPRIVEDNHQPVQLEVDLDNVPEAMCLRRVCTTSWKRRCSHLQN